MLQQHVHTGLAEYIPQDGRGIFFVRFAQKMLKIVTLGLFAGHNQVTLQQT